jgi:hypothetical protein
VPTCIKPRLGSFLSRSTFSLPLLLYLTLLHLHHPLLLLRYNLQPLPPLLPLPPGSAASTTAPAALVARRHRLVRLALLCSSQRLSSRRLPPLSRDHVLQQSKLVAIGEFLYAQALVYQSGRLVVAGLRAQLQAQTSSGECTSTSTPNSVVDQYAIVHSHSASRNPQQISGRATHLAPRACRWGRPLLPSSTYPASSEHLTYTDFGQKSDLQISSRDPKRKPAQPTPAPFADPLCHLRHLSAICITSALFNTDLRRHEYTARVYCPSHKTL